MKNAYQLMFPFLESKKDNLEATLEKERRFRGALYRQHNSYAAQCIREGTRMLSIGYRRRF